MKKNIFILLAVAISFGFLNFVSAESIASKKEAVYFYSESCVHCKKVDEYFQNNGVYETYEIEKIESSGPYNMAYLNKFFDAFRVPADKRGFPVIFFENRMILGDEPIIQNFISEIEKTNSSEKPTPEKVSEFFGKNNDIDNGEKNVSLAVLVWAALVDAINPCAFAVLILLMATVISAKGRKGGLYSGLLFSLAIFISYFLMGMGIYKVISFFDLPRIFSIAIGALSIIIGLANLKDFFWYGKFFVMEVPFSWRPKMQTIIRNVTSPIGAFGAGFFVSLFLLPCTSGPYVVILGLLAQKENLMRTVSLLFVYNAIFVLPMIAITLGMYWGIRARGLEEWRKNNIRLLHLIAGAIMLFIGIYLMYNWI